LGLRSHWGCTVGCKQLCQMHTLMVSIQTHPPTLNTARPDNADNQVHNSPAAAPDGPIVRMPLHPCADALRHHIGGLARHRLPAAVGEDGAALGAARRLWLQGGARRPTSVHVSGGGHRTHHGTKRSTQPHAIHSLNQPCQQKKTKPRPKPKPSSNHHQTPRSNPNGLSPVQPRVSMDLRAVHRRRPHQRAPLALHHVHARHAWTGVVTGR